LTARFTARYWAPVPSYHCDPGSDRAERPVADGVTAVIERDPETAVE
jgi:hypothetical protein